MGREDPSPPLCPHSNYMQNRALLRGESDDAEFPWYCGIVLSDEPEQDLGGTARLTKLYGTKSSVGGGASGAHPAYTWKRGQIWGCAQRGVRQCAGPCLGTVTAQLGGQHKVSCSSLVGL